jgi:hypothetical protein
MSQRYTYLEIVNGVLTRLREDTVLTLAGSDDVVVNLAKEYVNDAKTIVEKAHVWSALSYEWTLATVEGEANADLPDSDNSCIIDYVYDGQGFELKQNTKEFVRSRSLQSAGETASPRYYAIDGMNQTTGDLRLKLYPTPDATDTYTVYGYRTTDRLVNDTDAVFLPYLPILYYATALAARERGEVGGQGPDELMAIAKKYLQDAVAMEATNSDLENIWTTV